MLVIGVGTGCKDLGPFLTNCTKRYEATGIFGVSYDTDDVTGTLLCEKPFDHITEQQIQESLTKSFTGKIMQRPPSFSAKKINGVRAFEIARKIQSQLGSVNDGAEMIPELTLPSREITVFSIRLTSVMLPSFTISMDVSSGTYVRAILRDLGKELNTEASMSALNRTRQGVFTISDCMNVNDILDADKGFDRVVDAISNSKRIIENASNFQIY